MESRKQESPHEAGFLLNDRLQLKSVIRYLVVHRQLNWLFKLLYLLIILGCVF